MACIRRRGNLILGVCLFALAGCTLSESNVPSVSISTRDHYQDQLDPFKGTEATKAVVLVFTRVDCPISNRYAPRVESLYHVYREKGVAWYLVYPDPTMTKEQIESHCREYQLTVPALWDPEHRWVARAAATITPEVAVFDATGMLRYHGQIDNQYQSLGKYRPEPTESTLTEAIDALLAGKEPLQPYVPSVGCLISDLQALSSDQP